MSGSWVLRRAMIADSGSVTGPSGRPSVRSSSRISGPVWRCRSLVTCSVICQAKFASAMRPAYGAEEIRIGQHLLTIVVDVANVMGSRPDGWWRDRTGAAVRLPGELVLLAASGRAVPPDEPAPQEPAPAFVMVLEGAARAATARIGVADLAGLADEVRSGEVTVVQAPGSG